jgi:hypothetical protein
MKRNVTGKVLGALALFCAASAIGEPATNAANRLTVFLTDGSRIVGTSPKESMSFRAGFGRIEIPFALVASLAMNRDGETAVVQFRNDDRVTGVPMLDVVAVDAVFGSFKIPLTSIRRFMVSGLSNVADVDLHYVFDDAGEQVPDNSGKSRNGQAIRVRYRTDAVGDKVAVFGGGAHIVVGGTPISFDRDFTIAAWVCPERPAANEWEPMIVSRWTGQPTKGVRLSLRGPRDNANTGKLCLVGDTGEVVGFGETALGPGAWRHVAVTFQQEGQKATFFVDGHVDGTTSGRGSFSSADTELLVACGNWPRGTSGFVGAMDDLVIAARSLGETEVKALFERNAARAGTPLAR